ncbi:MAG: VTT domain-containing protein [Clostridia bacterium]|nr:VTT domain-containing protein [Clostridia bacterium]
MNKTIQRIIIAVSVLAVAALFAYFLKDILVPYVKFEVANDLDSAKELLISKGIFGFLTVILVEALQMVVIFIPAEFIQISSGMSYPFYIALLLCDLGVCLGATIIFVLVRVFRFSSKASEMGEAKINRLTAGKKNGRGTVLMMYLLFIMPIIPFGAICYYGSRRDLGYGKYIRTVATGVIPSIVTSNIMGAATKYFIGHSLPIWLLVLIIVLLAAVLFAVLAIFLNKVYFKENEGTPDSILNDLFFRFVHFFRKRKQRLHIDDSLIRDLPAPYIMLLNHESYYDFYYSRQLFSSINPAYVINRHYMSRKIARNYCEKACFIPKRLFTSDFVTPMKIMRTLKKGYSIVIFPEGRLSITGRSYPIVDRSSSFYRRLKVDVVIASINGAFFANPKWRKKFYKSDIYLRAERVIKADEIKSMTDDEFRELVEGSLYHDASLEVVNKYPQKDKSEGLEKVLYRCAFCGELYTTKGVGNDFTCSACGKTLHFDENYRFTEAPHTIGEYYDRIIELEKKELDSLDFKVDVDTVIFSEEGRYRTKEQGVCTLTAEGFAYTSPANSFSVGFDLLPALPFSCGEEFETYHDERLFYFYPKKNRIQVARWALIVDLIKELSDEKEEQS